MEIKQASDVYISIPATVNGEPLLSTTAAKYIVFTRDGTILLEKTLGNGITFANSTFTIHLTDTDTNTLGPGKYEHECVTRDVEENDSFILKGNFKIIKTLARN